MAPSDDDLSDELLALAGDADERSRKKRSASGSGGRSNSSKRRKQDRVDMDSEDDEGAESEEEEEIVNPYPLEGKYKDEQDRQRLMQMTELEREDIISTRLEEMQAFTDKKNLQSLVSRNQTGKDADTPPKRARISTGQTKEKSRVLAKLTEKRRAKKQRDNQRAGLDDGELSPYKQRSLSPSDESTDEEGQFTRFDQDEANAAAKAKEGTLTVQDLEHARLSRDLISKYCNAPFFEEYVKGGWVRYLVGADEKGQAVYRICEVINIGDAVKPYKLNDQIVKQTFELKHGKAEKHWPMDKVSNSPFTAGEFERLVMTYKADNVKMPSKSKLDKKAQQMQTLASKRLTESDVNAMIERRKKQQTGPTAAQLVYERSRLIQARNLASKRNDTAEVDAYTQKLANLEQQHLELFGDKMKADLEVDRFGKVNEMNRKAQAAAVKKAEELERERKKMLARENGNLSGTSTPVRDLSARVKTLPRVRHEMSRPSTPGLSQSVSTPEPGQGPSTELPKASSQTSMAMAVDIDLDF